MIEPESRQICGESIVGTYAPSNQNVPAGRIGARMDYQSGPMTRGHRDRQGNGDAGTHRMGEGGRGTGAGGQGAGRTSKPPASKTRDNQPTNPHPTRLSPHLRLGKASITEKYPLSKNLW